ncbi:ATP-dependent DNA helicase [Fructilactobacillus lindneri]|nr:RNA polymerase recycling motor HelD [Fructilactobacillus lindneri]ANZ57361.1 ATP-dependent DNA helicase [Fructilactobacillus lindneri]ANZ58626.1 ATP-dependent DNA helicase [Fructilactobacillus lindneri]POG97664.1 ATP-dependent DNA helicase [Fructilactobacillus lindneri]POG99001.1 ATP-dependent DNA helicase [Fructilactobacillus lindneri]POG99322.1 ATP-dependent DNA helicase [Fructilactobacillus lindneri]
MNKHEEQQEQERVTFVSQLLANKIKKTKQEVENAKAETQQVQKNYETNTSVNYLEADDRIETKAELQQQRSLVNKVVEDENIMKRQLDTYQELHHSPYFGRIDIQDEGFSDTDKLYIGTASLIDQDGEFLIHDWRAPISSVYYNGTLGKVSYQTPNGQQNTKLLKKRQFQIKDGKIINLFDTNETVGDELLQKELSSKSPEAMKNIVATIQREQNDIIRDTKSDLLVVQGVAGSGKTSALLQRIAFLLYHSRNDLNAEQILLFSPNLLFSNYIKEVLPSLGEHNMRQVTLAKFFSQRMEGMQVQTLFNRFENQELNTGIHEFKGSQKFINNIDDYLQNLKPQDIIFTDIHFQGETYFSKDEIQKIYGGLNQNLPLADKLLKTKNTLIKQLKQRIKAEINSKWVADRLDSLSDEQYHALLGDQDIDDFTDFDAEHDYIATQLVKQNLKIVYDAIYNDSFWDVYTQYQKFLEKVSLSADIAQSEWKADVKQFQDKLEYHQIRLDDAAPILYLRDKFTGENKNNAIKYLFIDEVQDYSIAEIMYLKLIFRNAKFNLIGDSEQAIFKDVESAPTLLNKLNNAISVRHPRLIYLNRSYRSTYPITTFASSILPDGINIEAFNRAGNKPILYQANSEMQMKQQLKDLIKQELKDHQTVAIITKNQAEAKTVYRTIRSDFETLLVTDSARSINQKVVVLPVYLAKGLEFDSVIGWDISKQNYPDQHSLGVLYTIMTRAMHNLSLLSNGPVTPLIPKSAFNNKLVEVK